MVKFFGTDPELHVKLSYKIIGMTKTKSSFQEEIPF